jgi:hypothetical protein
MDLSSVRVAFVRTGKNGKDRTVSDFMSVPDAMTKGHIYEKSRECVRGTGIILELRLQTRQPTRFADREVLIVKKVGD